MDIRHLDLTFEPTPYLHFTERTPKSYTQTLSGFRTLFVNSSHLLGLPSNHELHEQFLKRKANDIARFDKFGLNTDFLVNLFQLQDEKPSVFISGGLPAINERYKRVEVYNTGPDTLNPKQDITITPPLWQLRMLEGVGGEPIYPLWTMHHGRFETDMQSIILVALSIAELKPTKYSWHS